MTTNHTSYVYVGLAGETAPGRVVKSGLYRMAVGDDKWELITRGLPEAPAIRAIATHPEHPEIVYVGTQSGPYRSTDQGDHWEKLNIPDHGLPVWSLLFDPRDPKVMYAGYENCEIFRSEDGGESWQDQRPGACADCHTLLTHTAAPNTVYEAAGDGFAESEDFGESWAAADTGLKHRYVWGLAADWDDPTLLYVSAAAGPGQAHRSGFSDAAIYRRRAVAWWEPVAERLAEFPYALVADLETPGALYAGFGGGTILHSLDAGTSWNEFARVPGLDALAVVPT